VPFKHSIGVAIDEVGLGENSLVTVLTLLGLGFRFCQLLWNHK
jgi:hypothetical protein